MADGPTKAKAKGARQPKVYWAEIDGLNEWIVAAPNRAEALAAFGVRQNLFAEGAAGEESGPDKVEAARAQPGVPLRRPKGSKAAFSAPTGASDWSAAAPKGSKPKPRAKADREALGRAEARLKAVEDEHRQALTEIEEDRARLDERAAREAQRHDAAKAQAEAERDKAAEAFRQAGGR
jgi:hypothetical protein